MHEVCTWFEYRSSLLALPEHTRTSTPHLHPPPGAPPSSPHHGRPPVPLALLMLHAAATLYMLGLTGSVQQVHCPLSAQVGADSFIDCQQAHIRRTSWAVGPAMRVAFGTATLTLFSRPVGAPRRGAGVPHRTRWMPSATVNEARLPRCSHDGNVPFPSPFDVPGLSPSGARLHVPCPCGQGLTCPFAVWDRPPVRACQHDLGASHAAFQGRRNESQLA